MGQSVLKTVALVFACFDHLAMKRNARNEVVLASKPLLIHLLPVQLKIRFNRIYCKKAILLIQFSNSIFSQFGSFSFIMGNLISYKGDTEVFVSQ